MVQVPQLPDTSDLLTSNVTNDAAGPAAFAKGEDGWVDMAQQGNVEEAVAASAVVPELAPQNGLASLPVVDPEKAAGAEATAAAIHGTDDVNLATAQGRACAARRFMIYVHRCVAAMCLGCGWMVWQTAGAAQHSVRVVVQHTTSVHQRDLSLWLPADVPSACICV